jgi:hypothetical protein
MEKESTENKTDYVEEEFQMTKCLACKNNYFAPRKGEAFREETEELFLYHNQGQNNCPEMRNTKLVKKKPKNLSTT